jgi:hypothetical protein
MHEAKNLINKLTTVCLNKRLLFMFFTLINVCFLMFSLLPVDANDTRQQFLFFDDAFLSVTEAPRHEMDDLPIFEKGNGEEVFDSYLLEEKTLQLENGKDHGVKLIGTREPSFPSLSSEMFLEVTPPDKAPMRISLPPSGYEYPMEAYSFVSCDKREIFISVQNGGMAFFTCDYVVEVVNGRGRILFDWEEELGSYCVNGEFLEGFRLESRLPAAGLSVLLDLSEKKDTYDAIYDIESGEIREGAYCTTTPGFPLTVRPMDVDGDAIHELVSDIQCRGDCNADTLGVYRIVWKYRNDGWERIGWQFVPSEGVKLISMTEVDPK